MVSQGVRMRAAMWWALRAPVPMLLLFGLFRLIG
jgi:hypothetical protein